MVHLTSMKVLFINKGSTVSVIPTATIEQGKLESHSESFWGAL